MRNPLSGRDVCIFVLYLIATHTTGTPVSCCLQGTGLLAALFVWAEYIIRTIGKQL
jgi:hypothetical protein